MGELEPLANLGMAGAVIIVLVVQVRYLQGQLVEVIKANTAAMEQLKAAIGACQFVHRGGDK